MNPFLLLPMALLLSGSSLAQQVPVLTIKAGQNIKEVLSPEDLFYYPQFTNGNVFFLDGNRGVAKLNYNRLADEMHFINPKGDTLVLANEKTIKHIIAGSDTYYYDKGYLRLITGNERIKLVVKQVWMVSDARRYKADKGSTRSVFADYLSSFKQGGSLYDLTASADMMLTKEEQYYFGDKNGRYVLVGKRNLLLLFPKEQNRILNYLKENNISFTDKEDLKNVVRFLSSY